MADVWNELNNFQKHRAASHRSLRRRAAPVSYTHLSTATRMLQLMEKRGLIVRQPVASDGRLKKICLTDKGRQFHQVVIQGAQALERQLEEDLTERELEAFFAITAKIRKNLEK